MDDTIWAAIWGAVAGAGFAYLAAERQRLSAQQAQIIDEARREIAPRLDSYGHWLVRVRQVFVDIDEDAEDNGVPDYERACAELESIAAERERHAEQLRSLRYYRVALPQYERLTDDLLSAHGKLGDALDMSWMYFRFEVDPKKCDFLVKVMMTAVAQFAVLVAKTRDSVLDDVLQPVFHPILGRARQWKQRRQARREHPVDFAVEPHPTDWDPFALRYEGGHWIIGQRLFLNHPDLQALLDEEWDYELPPRTKTPPQGA